MTRKINFNPGPAVLPLEALEKAQKEFLDFRGTGMSILEISHRSKDFEQLLEETKALLAKLMGIPPTHKVIFLGGGASLQFAMLPMNFLSPDQAADYIVTGAWSQKAVAEAKLFGKVNIAASSEEDKFTFIPSFEQIKYDKNAVYVHMTSNNTIFGTQWQRFPDTGNVPLICDMSSDFLSRKVDVSKFAMIYAGAQKNIGTAGVTVVIMRDDFAAKEKKEGIAKILRYSTHLKENSLYNTPPVFAIYMSRLFLEWIDQIGGVAEIEKRNRQKQVMVYKAIDDSGGFYRGTVRPDSRSWMNATLRLTSEELEKEFLSAASAQGFVGLKGHRSVGGIRVSMYNAVSVSDCEKLVDFVKDFRKKH